MEPEAAPNVESLPTLLTIPNAFPHVTTMVRLTYPFERLCPVSAEPQPGSSIMISYQAQTALLETKALRRYLESFAGENPHGVRDLEEAAQTIAQTCCRALATRVTVTAMYRLQHGDMQVEAIATPDPFTG